MAQVIFNEEWMVEYGLMLRTGLGATRNLQRFRRQEDKVAKRAVPVCSEIPQPGFHKIARSLPQNPMMFEPGSNTARSVHYLSVISASSASSTTSSGRSTLKPGW